MAKKKKKGLMSKKPRKTKGKHRKLKKSRVYQRGDLGRAIFSLFDKVGIYKVNFEQALKVAKKAKPDTTFGSAYYSWFKNAYRNEHDL